MLIATAGVLPGSAGFAEPAPELNLVTSPWPPFSGPIGETRFAVELVEEAFSRAGYAPQTHLVGVGEVTAALRSGQYAGSPAFWKDATRESEFLFSDPYLQNRLILVAREGTDVSATDWSDLRGERVAIVRNYAYGEAVEAVDGPIFVPGSDHQANLTRLLAGGVDYILMDSLLVRHLQEYQSAEVRQFLEIGEQPLLTRTLHCVVRRDYPNAGALMAAFNQAIREMIRDGAFNEVLKLNWLRADVDGDGNLELVLSGTGAGIAAPDSGYDVSPFQPGAIPEERTDRYWIDGQLYTGWEEVPDRYKVEENRWRDPSNTGVSLLNFHF